MEPITTAAIASTLIFKAFEKSGEKIGEAIASRIGQLINVIREKFKAKGVEGILTQAEDNPTEANKKMLQTILEMQVSQDEAFAHKLKELVDELKSNNQVNQVFLKGIDVSGSAKVGDFSQIVATPSNLINQEAATNLKVSGNLEIGDGKQQA